MDTRPTSTRLELKVCNAVADYSRDFLQGMLNRMLVSHYKYGPLNETYPTKIDALRSLEARLDEYRRTGNTEFLIDAANFAMIEFMHPSVHDAEFRPTDSDASPGRIASDGSTTYKKNSDVLLKR